MSKEQFDDSCEGCKPAMIDVRTGKMLPDDHPDMMTVIKIWEEQPLETKQAWHRVTCLNSRTRDDWNACHVILQLIKEAYGAPPTMTTKHLESGIKRHS